VLYDSNDYLKLPCVPPQHTYAYGPEASQFGHLYLPPGRGSRPVILVIHGGCWQAEYGLLPMSALCSALAGEGLAVWNLEYRRLGDGGGWPATFHDVAAGADFLRTIAASHELDLDRLVALGHSAGGHLALWLAGRHRLPAGSELASAMNFAAAPAVVSSAVRPSRFPNAIGKGRRRISCRWECRSGTSSGARTRRCRRTTFTATSSGPPATTNCTST